MEELQHLQQLLRLPGYGFESRSSLTFFRPCFRNCYWSELHIYITAKDSLLWIWSLIPGYFTHVIVHIFGFISFHCYQQYGRRYCPGRANTIDKSLGLTDRLLRIILIGYILRIAVTQEDFLNLSSKYQYSF